MILARRLCSEPFEAKPPFHECQGHPPSAAYPPTFRGALIIERSGQIYKSVHLDRQWVLAVTTQKRVSQTLTVQQAASNSPSLARLTDLVQESNDRLKAIEPLIPETLRSAVKAGPIDGEGWCLLVDGNAAAAKIRQLLPVIQASLLRHGRKVDSIRLKVLLAKK